MNPRLPECIQDAQLLLAYAAKNGIAVDRATINIVVKVGNKSAGGTVSDQDEAAFWPALESLAAKISPVTVLSLHATMDVRATDARGFLARLSGGRFGQRSAARRAVLWYTFLAFYSLITLVVVQIFWLFGLAVTGDIAETRATYEKISTSMATARPEDQARFDDQRNTLELQARADYKILERWSALWGVGGDSNKESCSSFSRDVGAYESCMNISRESSVKLMLSILQSILLRYFLPLLYGLLGASVYILRTLSSQIRARTYTEASNIDFRIRLCLGTLGGMVSAWFINPEAGAGLIKTLSPFAIAFLSGYSVELLLALMDKIISTFTKQQ